MIIFDWFKRRTHASTAWPLGSAEQFVDAWKRIVVGDEKSWVLFRHGTCVILMDPESDLSDQAIGLLKEWGPVHAGSPAGDFRTVALTEHPGWVVSSHHDDILTYVAPGEVPTTKEADIAIGLFGRHKRDQDATDLDVIHVEDRRKTSSA